jgi:uncharacterized protein
MFKWLIFIFLGYVVYLYWQRRQLPRPKRGRDSSQSKGPERMVACTHCGIHLPESESLSDDDRRSYCCEEHRRLGSKRTG